MLLLTLLSTMPDYRNCLCCSLY